MLASLVENDVRYPVGEFRLDPDITVPKRRRWLQQMADAPATLASAVHGLDDRQLDTPYREGGWTPRQVVHHLADAHMNGFVRFKLAVTEDQPAIKTYEEDLWGETADVRGLPWTPRSDSSRHCTSAGPSCWNHSPRSSSASAPSAIRSAAS